MIGPLESLSHTGRYPLTMLLRTLLIALVASVALARDEATIQEVTSGKRTEARAEWWGFDETDATQALQSAINSKAKKVIVSNTGKPWNVRPIKLASDQEIVFEKGVVVQAVRGEFKKPQDMLILGQGVKNVTLSGDGATLKMWKADYQSPPYTKSEWRHALAFYACENVTIRGLLIADSGGDGIYLGAGSVGKPCKQVSIQDVRCINHHRQGISVISAEDLLIENCAFNDTQGTAPQAGIDFEPNSARERLKNCVLRNCTFNNNHSYGILFALGQLDYDTEPLGIRLENCRTLGSLGALRVVVRNPSGVRGSIAFDRCHFEGSTKGGIGIDNKAVKGVALTFTHCDLVDLAVATPNESPIVIKSGGNAVETLGGIVFDDCTIEQKEERRPLFYDDVGGARLKAITGTLTVKSGTESKRIEITQALLDQWFPWSAELTEYARFDMQGLAFEPAFPHARRPFPAFEAWQRETAQFVVWGREGGTLDFTLTLKPVGKSAIKEVPVQLVSPSGKVTELPSPKGTEPRRYGYHATETGLHRVVVEAGSHTVTIHSATDAACLMSPRGAFHFVWQAGPLYFLVPKGVTEFGVKVAGGGGTELVKATIKDAGGKIVVTKDNIGHGESFPLKRSDAAHPEVWSVNLERATQGVLEDVQLLLEGVPPLLAASPETILRPVVKGTEEPPRFFKLPQLVLIGDSLVASYPKPPPDRPTLTGWGQVLDKYMADGVGVRNEARSGASSKSFLTRGFWQTTLDGPAADYLLLQFGGNDIKDDDRFTDPATTFQDLLRAYINMARGLGMKPVLVSSPVSRNFNDKGKIITTLDAYVAAMKRVAEKEQVPYLDVQASSKAFFEKLGDKGCAKYNASAADHGHFSREGALAVAKLVAEGLRAKVPELAPLVKISAPGL